MQISEDVIGSVEAIVMSVAAGRVNAQFREARKGQNETTKENQKD